MRLLILTLVSCLLVKISAPAQRLDSIHYAEEYPYHNTTEHTLTRSLPLLAVSGIYSLHNRDIAGARNSVMASFHNRYDDYLQFAPLATQLGMHAFGVRGRSRSTAELLTADALSTAIVLGVVTATKDIARVRRPDGSAYNSFPSGHTAMAFASATMLHHEYGERYPWISAVGYLSAAGTGIGRILNNRHWIGDVVTGAVVGTISAELGYWLSDRIWRRGKAYSVSYDEVGPSEGFLFAFPSYLGIGENVLSRQMGLSVRWRYSKAGYFGFARIMLESNRLRFPSDTSMGSADEVSAFNSYSQAGWGREWGLGPRWLTMDTAVSIGIEHHDRGKLFSAHLSPRLYLSRSVSLRADAQYTLSTRTTSTMQVRGDIYDFRRPPFTFGVALECRL